MWFFFCFIIYVFFSDIFSLLFVFSSSIDFKPAVYKSQKKKKMSCAKVDKGKRGEVERKNLW